jgi:hypothetical protein
MYGEFGKNKSQLKRSNEKVKMLFDLCADKFHTTLNPRELLPEINSSSKKGTLYFRSDKNGIMIIRNKRSTSCPKVFRS